MYQHPTGYAKYTRSEFWMKVNSYICSEVWINIILETDRTHARTHVFTYVIVMASHCVVWHFWVCFRKLLRICFRSYSCWHSCNYTYISEGCYTPSGSLVVKSLCLQARRSRVQDPMRWMHFSVYLILPVEIGPGLYSAHNRNEYQKQKNNVSGEVMLGRYVRLTTSPPSVSPLSSSPVQRGGKRSIWADY
jgi:hypothetical protein